MGITQILCFHDCLLKGGTRENASRRFWTSWIWRWPIGNKEARCPGLSGVDVGVLGIASLLSLYLLACLFSVRRAGSFLYKAAALDVALSGSLVCGVFLYLSVSLSRPTSQVGQPADERASHDGLPSGLPLLDRRDFRWPMHFISAACRYYLDRRAQDPRSGTEHQARLTASLLILGLIFVIARVYPDTRTIRVRRKTVTI